VVGGEIEMSARTAILDRIRAARSGPAGDAAADYAAIPREYRQSGSLDSGARLDLFRERLRDYGVTIASDVASALNARQLTGLLVPPGFPPDLLPPGFDFTEATGLDYNAMDRSTGVITTCAAAIAFTGTIVLEDLAPGQGPRALSLIPDYHLCIVETSQIFETVPEAIRFLDARQIRTLTTISGPSATSDIEMTRVRGVHGPRTLEVIVR
jgi:L-lactate dehydrogenase complex protein LldG